MYHHLRSLKQSKENNMNIERFKNLEDQVNKTVINLCEMSPELVEDLYDDNEKKNDEIQDIAMRRALAKRLFV